MMPDWLNVLLKSIALLIVLFFFTKWLGKKHISQLNIFQYITGFVLAGIVAITAVNPKANFLYGLIAMFTWFIIPFTIDYLSLKNKKLRDFVQGKSTVFIQDGKIMENNLKNEGYTTDDLLQHLRYNNMFQASDVEFAILEPSGTLSVLPKTENRPLTAKDIDLKLAPKNEPQTIIMDGKISYESLANLTLNVDWLDTELEKLNVTLENVFLAQADSDAQLTVDLYDDKLTVASPTEKPLLLATLKKCQADLDLFSLATDNQEAKEMYNQNAIKLSQAITIVKDFLR